MTDFFTALAGTKRRSNEWWWLKQGYKKGPNGEWIAPSNGGHGPGGGGSPPGAGATASGSSALSGAAEYDPTGGLKVYKEAPNPGASSFHSFVSQKKWSPLL